MSFFTITGIVVWSLMGLGLLLEIIGVLYVRLDEEPQDFVAANDNKLTLYLVPRRQYEG